jgi:hypothetical protein
MDPAIRKSRPTDVIDGDLAYWTGGIHALLREREDALAWPRRAAAVGDHNYPWFQKDKNYDSLRGDREYQRLMEEVRRHWEQYKRAFGVSSCPVVQSITHPEGIGYREARWEPVG